MTTSSSTANGAPTGKRQLNVLFHGLWAWEAQPDKIIAHTPIEAQHKICVGDFDAQQDIQKGATLVLGGIDAGKANAFEPLQNLLIRDQPFVDASKRHCAVELPIPGAIRSVRRVTVTEPQPFSGADGQNLHPIEVAMVEVFIYEFDNPDAVTLSTSSVKPRMNPDNQTANLHFFAQPPGGHHHDDTFKTAYENMALMFGLKITPVEALFAKADVDPGIPGLTKEDLRLLGETLVASAHSHVTLQAESGSNCDGLVVDNRNLSAKRARRYEHSKHHEKVTR